MAFTNTEAKNFTVAGLTTRKKSGTILSNMNSFLSRINPFRKPTIAEVRADRIKEMERIIQECETARAWADYNQSIAEATLQVLQKKGRHDSH